MSTLTKGVSYREVEKLAVSIMIKKTIIFAKGFSLVIFGKSSPTYHNNVRS